MQDISGCFQSWGDELLARADRVRKLIGRKHWLSDGHHKEEILRDFLRRHIPNRFEIGRGFVVGTSGGKSVSPEVDILISDSQSELPWLKEGGLIVAPPVGVCAHIHVKTKANNAEILDVFESIHKTEAVFHRNAADRGRWSAGVFFNAGTNGTSEEKWISILTKASLTNASQNRNGKESKYRNLPRLLTVIGGPLFLFDEQQAQWRGYNCSKIGPAVLLMELYDAISAGFRDTRKASAIEEVIEASESQLFCTIKL